MPIKIFGDSDFRKYRKAVLFLSDETLVSGEGNHGALALRYFSHVNSQRKLEGIPQLTTGEMNSKLIGDLVSLMIRNNIVYIRPNTTPELRRDKRDIGQIIKTDELLQELLPKQNIKFLGILDNRIRQAIKERGELWRINTLPKTTAEMIKMIAESKVKLFDDIYGYESMETGTLELTLDEIKKAKNLAPEDQAAFLHRIKDLSLRKNKQYNPELAFFMAANVMEGYSNINFSNQSKKTLGMTLDNIIGKLSNAVPREYAEDDIEDVTWRDGMYSSLMGQVTCEGEVCEISEEDELGLCPELHLHVQWEPGANIRFRELDFDHVFQDKIEEDKKIYDEKVMYIIRNAIEKKGRLDYINVGRVVESVSKREPMAGRREVYIASYRIRGEKNERTNMIRMQKWTPVEIMERDKVTLEQAVLRSEQYKINIEDRYEACVQLGMPLVPFDDGTICEVIQGEEIGINYYIRDYVRGNATDKIPKLKFSDPVYAMRFAILQGKRAVSAMAVGKTSSKGRIFFDDGDEILIETDKDFPRKIMVLEMTGAFNDCSTPLIEFAPQYAQCIMSRMQEISDSDKFADIWVRSFVKRFKQLQADYKKNRKTFKLLALGRQYDAEKRTFAYLWDNILDRLENSDADEIGNAVLREYKRFR